MWRASDSWAGSDHVPGCAVTAVDTTAAGDAFNSALAVEGIAERSALASHTGGGGVVRGRQVIPGAISDPGRSPLGISRR